MKKAIFAICIIGMSAALAITTEPIDGGGTALIVDAAALGADEVAALNGNTVQELWKTGTSTLEVSGIGSFTGVIRVKGGIYKPLADTGMGASSCVIYVTQGGCLYSQGYGAGRTIHFAGTGYGDYPAIVKNGSNLNLVMDDDATIGFIGNWCSVCSSLNMNGKTLTFKYAIGASRSESVWPSASNVSNPGHIIIDAYDSANNRYGRLTFLNRSDQMQGSDHTITIRNGSIDWYSSAKKTNWKMIVEAGKTQSIGYGGTGALSAGQIFRWGGPIVLGSGATLTLRPGVNNPVLVDGDISGAGNVKMDGESKTTVAYLKGRSTYTGTTTVAAGTLVLHSLDSIASLDPTKWSVTADQAIALCVNGGALADGFSNSDVQDVFTAFKSWATSKPVRLAVTNGVVANIVFDKTSTSDNFATGTYTNSVFGFLGSVHLNATFANEAPFVTYGNGICEASATSDTVQDVGRITVYCGTTVLKNFGHVHNNTNSISVNAYAPGGEREARLILDEGTYIDQGWEINGQLMNIASDGTHGILEIRDGAAITNNLNNFGSGSGAYGAIYQTGGYAYWARQSGHYDAYYGKNGGHAYINVSGGRMETRQHTHFSDTLSGTMLLEVCDTGHFRAGGAEFHIGWGGTSVVYQTGGVLDTVSSSSVWLRLCASHYTKYCANGYGALVVADDGLAKVLSNGILMTERTNGVAHVALIDGGTLETKVLLRAVERGAKNGSGSPELLMPFPELCDGGKAFPSFVHFNGGVLRARAAGNLLGARTETADTRPTDVLVYGKGAILDSSNYTVTVNAPLKAPTGKGVVSIELPTGAVRSGYLGAPVVSIYGDGEGATAVAIFDKDTGTISGFRITSPGRDYTTATARLAGGGKSSITNILACTVAENTSGGLTKRGTGLLALNAANTYGGRTVLEGGVLRLDADGALPSGSAVELAGGALDANGHAGPTDWRLDFSKVVAAGAPIICPGSLDFPAGSTLTIENVDDEFLAAQEGGFPLLSVTGLVTGTPALAGLDNPLWRLVWRGGNLYASSMRGTAIILR